MTDFPDIAEAPTADAIGSVRALPLIHCSTKEAGGQHSARCFVGDCGALRTLQHLSKSSKVSDTNSIIEYAIRGNKES